VDAELEASSADNVSQREERIVSQWREVSSDEQHKLREKFDEILRPLGLQTRLLVVERANSIALYFFCMTLLAVTSLRDLWRNGDLRRTVESLLTFLAGTARSVRIKKLTWPLSDYERCLQFLSFLQGKPTISVLFKNLVPETSKTQLCSLITSRVVRPVSAGWHLQH